MEWDTYSRKCDLGRQRPSPSNNFKNREKEKKRDDNKKRERRYFNTKIAKVTAATAKGVEDQIIPVNALTIIS